ncbi:helix-turn-helix transcriptional regulator [Priestia aryabhattai]|uniref:helix-turn-helix transcriptional regulator n=1 Tax=Priestia aryabhattai TaxID=412384 RepID=UPI0008922812|nr:transcriptional regulator, AraC family [Priestia aryabhattai B8W22]
MKVNELGVLPTSELYIHTPNEFSRKHLFTIHFAGRYDCDINYIIERTFHDYYLLLKVTNGQLRLEFNQQIFTINANELLLFDCRIPHKYYATAPLSFEFIHFKGNASKELYEAIIELHGPVIPVINEIEVIKAVDVIFHMLEHNKVSDFKVSYEIHKIVSLLLETKNIFSPEPNLNDVIAFIDQNSEKPLSINDLANIASLSVYHFSRKFKKLTGLSPHEYLILKRLTNAKFLLKNTTFSINKISDMIGFSSPSHFIATFKKHMNMTPKEFKDFRF